MFSLAGMGGVMGYSPRTCLSPARGVRLAGENTPVQPTPKAKNLTLPGCPSLLYQSHDTGLTPYYVIVMCQKVLRYSQRGVLVGIAVRPSPTLPSDLKMAKAG
jgi:hypothetical protein